MNMASIIPFFHLIDMHQYDETFFLEDRDLGEQSAERMVPLLMELLRPSSVVDVGCALGTWLKVFERHGVVDYAGVDGEWVNRELLDIENARFVAADLSVPLRMPRRFDLVLCLEVAEHLPATSASTLVESLTGLGDIILFSAAVPSQTGPGHINEQWPAYWAQLFRAYGYVPADLVRPRIWNDQRIAWWYRQNVLLFIHERALASYPVVAAAARNATADPLSLIHPDNFLFRVSSRRFPAVRELWHTVRVLARAMTNGRTTGKRDRRWR